MNRSETKQILFIIQSSFPRFYKDISTEEKKCALDVWTDMFSEDPAEVVVVAVKKYIANNSYPPSIADIKNQIYKINNQDLNEMEAWALVMKAIKNGRYHSGEEFEKLPEVIKKAVGSSTNIKEWADMDVETIDSVIASNFRKTYLTELQRKKEKFNIPESVNNLIGNIGLLK